MKSVIAVCLILLTCGSFSISSWAADVVSFISQQELLHRIEAPADVLILDVRTPAEFNAGHVPGAINSPHMLLPSRLNEVRRQGQKEVVVYCETGPRAGIAEHVLREAGFADVRHLEGDMAAWRRTALPIVTPTR